MAKMTTRAPTRHAHSSGFHDRSSGRAGRANPARPAGRLAPDALSEVLQDLRLTDASYCRTEMHAPWGIEIAPEEGAVVHLVIDGTCWLRTAAAPALRLDPGDVVLLPHGAGHALVDAPTSATRPLRALPRERVGDRTFRLHGAGSGARALLVCCGISFEASAVHPLLRMMPEVLHVRCADSRDAVLATLLDTMAVEVREQRVGAATVMARLADIVVTRVIRAWAEAQPQAQPAARIVGQTGWLAAIRDPQIGRALAAFHHSPERDWSVGALAAAAHLSRSQFSERFAAALEVGPARYVAAWRMHLATRWLASERLSIGEVAARLGYDSEAAFSRAFKRIVGTPPSGLRRTA
jgi:AraC-like DNA-binding protein